jgi:hypothetical protein
MSASACVNIDTVKDVILGLLDTDKLPEDELNKLSVALLDDSDEKCLPLKSTFIKLHTYASQKNYINDNE